MKADVKVAGQRHLIFPSDHQLAQLSRARKWFVDGTFRIVKRPFYQLFSIHAFVRSGGKMKMMPLVFVLMSRRRKDDYVKILRKVKGLVHERLGLRCAVADFETDTVVCSSSCFPGCEDEGMRIPLHAGDMEEMPESWLGGNYFFH